MTDQGSGRSLAAMFGAAADMLEGHAAPEGPPLDLLSQLGYLDGAAARTANRAALLRAAAGFRRLFTLSCDDAPGLVAVGAEVDAPVSAGVSGTGLSFQQAFEACAGEGIEYASQFPLPDDRMEVLDDHDALAGATPALRALWERLAPARRGGPAAWSLAADLGTGAPVRIPADLCFRRPADQRNIDPPWPLSIGCAAAPDPLQAAVRGLLELIERDAVCLWWRGGRRGRILPMGTGAAMLAQLRAEVTRRRTWLLDISTDLSIPVVVAASCNPSGTGLCLGHAARPRLEDAAASALMEMAQMELAHQIALRKRQERGEDGLNALDRAHIDRYTNLMVQDVWALHPLAPPAPPDDLPAADPRETLAVLRSRLEEAGLAACVVNLTRGDSGVAVVRALCPGLEAGLAAPPGPRLLAAASETGTDWQVCPPL